MTKVLWSMRGCAALLTIALGSGCAALPQGTQLDPRDPFERGNRAMFKLNENLDKVAKPVARAYVKVVPRPIRTSLSNALGNAAYPTVIISQFLQGKLADGSRDTGRLLVNSILGLGGLFDVATDVGLERHDEDFGQVLGKWGVRAGPYIMLPVLGPSTMRDSWSKLPDQLTNGTHYVGAGNTPYALTAFRLLDDRANLLDGEKLLSRAGDRYVLVRSAWLQHREFEVSDGATSDMPPADELEDPEPEPSVDTTAAAPPAATPKP